MEFAAVTLERIRQILDKEEIRFDIDDDNEICIAFDVFVAWINLSEKVWRIFAIWRGEPQASQKDEMLFFVSQANDNRVAPKTVLTGEGTEESPYRIGMECCVPIMEGMTDEQMGGFVEYALPCFISMCNELAEAFPELAEPFTSEDEDDSEDETEE